MDIPWLTIHTTSAKRNHRRSWAGARIRNIVTANSTAGALRKSGPKTANLMGQPRTTDQEQRNCINVFAFRDACQGTLGVNTTPRTNKPPRTNAETSWHFLVRMPSRRWIATTATVADRLKTPEAREKKAPTAKPVPAHHRAEKGAAPTISQIAPTLKSSER